MLQGRPGVLGPDLSPFRRRLGADPHIWAAVDVHQAIGAFTVYAKKAARPVVLETATENANSRRIKGRSNRIAGKG